MFYFVGGTVAAFMQAKKTPETAGLWITAGCLSASVLPVT
jgi:hypothetical protein